MARQGTEPSAPQGPHHRAGLVLFPRLGSSLIFQCNWVQKVLTVGAVVFKQGLLQNNLNQPLKSEVIFFPAYRTWLKKQRNMDRAHLEVQQQCLALLRPFLSCFSLQSGPWNIIRWATLLAKRNWAVASFPHRNVVWRLKKREKETWRWVCTFDKETQRNRGSRGEVWVLSLELSQPSDVFHKKTRGWEVPLAVGCISRQLRWWLPLTGSFWTMLLVPPQLVVEVLSSPFHLIRICYHHLSLLCLCFSIFLSSCSVKHVSDWTRILFFSIQRSISTIFHLQFSLQLLRGSVSAIFLPQ